MACCQVFCGEVSPVTYRKTTSFHAISFLMGAMLFMAARQGPHQVAQKSMTSAFPGARLLKLSISFSGRTVEGNAHTFHATLSCWREEDACWDFWAQPVMDEREKRSIQLNTRCFISKWFFGMFFYIFSPPLRYSCMSGKGKSLLAGTGSGMRSGG